MSTEFTPFASFFGGMLIGTAALLLMAAHGRIAGISGIVASWFTQNDSKTGTNTAFMIGVLLGLPLVSVLAGRAPTIDVDSSILVMLIAGLLVGYGTVHGSGCTSGHGVCGISRLSTRSIIATVTFLLSGAVITFISRHLIGVGN